MNIIITGGHSGIGLELLKKLVVQEHKIGLILRNPERLNEELSPTLKNHPNLTFFFADLSLRNDINRVVEEITEKFDFIDILFNNAGVLLDNLYYSKQGNEMHFEVNTLAPYFLTKGLAHLLKKSEDGQVINTLTEGLHNRKHLEVDKLLKPVKFKKLFGSYMDSKFALLQIMLDYAEKEKGFRIINVGPGPNKTKMTAGKGMPSFLKIIRNLFFPHPSKGAEYLYDAAFNNHHKERTGLYLSSGKIRDVKYRSEEEIIETLISR